MRARRLRIELAGRLRISSGGRTVVPAALGGPRGLAAFARLALAAGDAVSRDELAEAVWGEAPPASWRPALRNVISDLRRGLAEGGLGDAIRSAGDSYRLELPPGSKVDLLTLAAETLAAERAAAGGDARAALRLCERALPVAYRPVLPGSLSEWSEALRRHVADLRERLELTAAEAALALGAHVEAVEHARAALADSPYREDAHRVLLRALAEAGDRGRAAATHEEFRGLLARDLGTFPSAETQRLHADLLADPEHATHTLGSVPPLAEPRRAAAYGVRVARTALEAGEYEDAVAIATRTLAALSRSEDIDPRPRVDLQILLGAAQRALGNPDGFETLHAAAAAARELGDAERLADAALAFTHTGAATEEVFVDDMLYGLYEEALAALGDRDEGRQARLRGHLAVGHAWVRGLEEAARLAAEAVEVGRATRDDACLLDVLTLARRSRTGIHDTETQERLEEELLALARRLDDPGGQARALIWRFHTRLEQGRGDELGQLLDDAETHVRGLRMGHYHHTLAYCRAAFALLRGDLDGGEALIEEAAVVGRRHGLQEQPLEALRLAQLVGLRHEQGRLAELRDEAVPFFAGAGVPLWLGVVAAIEAEAGNFEAAAQALAGYLDEFRRTGPTMLSPIGLAAFAAHPISRLGDRELATEVYDLVAPAAGQVAFFAYFAGPVDYLLGLLARVLKRDDEATRHFRAAAEFCERLGAPLWERRCRDAAHGELGQAVAGSIR